ncbi:MAG: DUF72 domain-containing protein [Bacteroidota bacterium]
MKNGVQIFVGTAGWSYKDWVPDFYPRAQSKSFDWLEYYSGFFNVVEVNATYYAYMNPSSARSWIEKVSAAENFLFTVKLHQDFTHARKYDNTSISAVKQVLDILASGGRLGGLLMQFPYSFSCNAESIEYMQRLNDVFKEYSQFVEIRHASWNNPEAYGIMSELNVTACTIDQPQLGRSIAFEPVITNDTCYFRFHGRNTDEWKKSVISYGKKLSYEEQSQRYKYLYSPGELTDIADKIRSVYESVNRIYIIMNNHPGSYGIVNAFELMYMLGSGDAQYIPEGLISAFPRLKLISGNS